MNKQKFSYKGNSFEVEYDKDVAFVRLASSFGQYSRVMIGLDGVVFVLMVDAFLEYIRGCECSFSASDLSTIGSKIYDILDREQLGIISHHMALCLWSMSDVNIVPLKDVGLKLDRGYITFEGKLIGSYGNGMIIIDTEIDRPGFLLRKGICNRGKELRC